MAEEPLPCQKVTVSSTITLIERNLSLEDPILQNRLTGIEVTTRQTQSLAEKTLDVVLCNQADIGRIQAVQTFHTEQLKDLTEHGERITKIETTLEIKQAQSAKADDKKDRWELAKKGGMISMVVAITGMVMNQVVTWLNAVFLHKPK
jgi:hypothetical protein